MQYRDHLAEYVTLIAELRQKRNLPATSQYTPPTKLSAFTESAMHQLQAIRQMSTFLQQSRAAYLSAAAIANTGAYDDDTSIADKLNSGNQWTSMSDEDRTSFETTVSRFILLAQKRCDALSAAAEQQDSERASEAFEREEDTQDGHDVEAYHHAVSRTIYSELQQLTSHYGQLRLQRTEQLRRQNYKLTGSDLEDAKQSIYTRSGTTPTSSSNGNNNPIYNLRNRKRQNGANGSGSEQHSANGNPQLQAELEQQQQAADTTPAHHFTEQEQALYETENETLVDTLSTNLDQLRTAESKLAEIGQMITLFATKVEEQDEQIGNIHSNTIDSVIHVTSGVDQLKRASRRGSACRRMSAYAIFIMALSLLFLDWFSG